MDKITYHYIRFKHKWKYFWGSGEFWDGGFGRLACKTIRNELRKSL